MLLFLLEWNWNERGREREPRRFMIHAHPLHHLDPPSLVRREGSDDSPLS